MISVWVRPPKLKRIAIPRGEALGSLSGIVGNPVELEKRTVMGVVGLLKWGARESFPASAEGVNVPVVKIPFPWAARKTINFNYNCF